MAVIVKIVKEFSLDYVISANAESHKTSETSRSSGPHHEQLVYRLATVRLALMSVIEQVAQHRPARRHIGLDADKLRARVMRLDMGLGQHPPDVGRISVPSGKLAP